MSMKYPLGRLARRDAPKPTLRERAAALKATAARVMRLRPADQPSRETLPSTSGVDRGAGDFPVREAVTDHSSRELPGTLSRDGAAAGRAPMEHAMGRHEIFEIGTPLADELLAGTMLAGIQRLDPVFVAIAETQRLHVARDSVLSLPQDAGETDPSPEQDAAREAFFNHLDDVLLKTVPTTGAGCAALCRYALEFEETNGWVLDEDASNNQHLRILDLIARSPMLANPPSQNDPANAADREVDDAALADAVPGLLRIDAEIDASIRRGEADGPNGAELTPAHADLEVQRDALLACLKTIPAEGLLGLRAKAQALLLDRVLECDEEAADIGEALAADVLRLTACPSVVVTQKPDPILTLIEQHRDLLVTWDAEPDEEAEADARQADVSMKRRALEAAMRTTVPTTAAGLRALVARLRENADRMGIKLGTDEGHQETDFVLDAVLNAAGQFQAGA